MLPSFGISEKCPSPASFALDRMYLFTYISPRAFSQDLRQTAGGATVDPPEDDDDRGGGGREKLLLFQSLWKQKKDPCA